MLWYQGIIKQKCLQLYKILQRMLKYLKNKQVIDQISKSLQIRQYFSNYRIIIIFEGLLTKSLHIIISFQLFESYNLNYIMQNAPSSQNVTVKVVLTLILLFIDLILSSFVQASFTLSSASIREINFYFLPIQIVITASSIIMLFILMWQTFPLRYGLIGTLFKEFKWSFLIIFIFIGFTAAERGLKLLLAITDTNYSQLNVIATQGYTVLYYIRFIFYPLYYAVIINFCMRIIDPSFYKPFRWLK